jgi:ABC-type Fe3+ transport system substrate-binding protein
MRREGKLKSLAAMSVLLVQVAGVFFAGTAMAADDWQAGAGEDWKKVLEAAKKEGKVAVSGHPSLAQPLSQAFKRDTGITLEFLSGDISELATRLAREARAGNVTVDVALGGGTEIRLLPDGLLNPIKPQLMLPGVLDSRSWRDGKTSWMDVKGEYMLKGSAYVSGFPVVNATIIKPDAIKTWHDLLKPEYRGKIASYDPRNSGPGQGSAAYLTHTFGLDFIKSLYIGQKVTYVKDGRQLAELAARGTHPIILGSVPSGIQPFVEQGFKLVPISPKDGPGYLTSGFSVLKQVKGVPHPNAATVFINWYMSKPGQEVYARTMQEASTRVDVNPKETPAHIVPKPGLKYLNTYEEVFYNNIRPGMLKEIVEALGGR